MTTTKPNHRPIKFRAFADDKMHEVRAISFTEDGELFRFLDAEGVQRVPIQLMQYTAYRDAKKREVYEGDIIAVNGQARQVIKWENNRWNHQLPAKTLYEVIGNLHENPELLRANQKAV